MRDAHVPAVEFTLPSEFEVGTSGGSVLPPLRGKWVLDPEERMFYIYYNYCHRWRCVHRFRRSPLPHVRWEILQLQGSLQVSIGKRLHRAHVQHSGYQRCEIDQILRLDEDDRHQGYSLRSIMYMRISWYYPSYSILSMSRRWVTRRWISGRRCEWRWTGRRWRYLIAWSTGWTWIERWTV